MCGIAGLFGSHLQPAANEAVLKDMLVRIEHRGPNETGLYLSNELCMGTVRLSIIDVGSGQQPMSDVDGHYFLCYNGEVYNYLELRDELRVQGCSFKTESDTEVVLQAWRAWGPQCLQRFNGAFAFALLDRREGTLYLVRDRYGKRPLFYAKHGDSVLFASEMKSFLAVPDFSFEFDSAQLSSIFTFWTPIADQSGFKGIYQVPQGSYAAIKGSQIVIKPYYQIDFSRTFVPQSEGEAIEAVAQALREAVRLRLRSDVEVGMYLSGGLDSSILASILAEQRNGRLRTFSVAFEDSEFDESADQLRMASYVDSRHEVLNVSASMLVEHFPAAVFHAEVPVFRTALVPMFLLSALVRDSGIKVVITGEGADEAFLGYDLFKETLLRRAWNSIGETEKLAGVRRLYPYLKHYSATNTVSLLGLYQQFSEERYPGLFSHEIRVQNGLFSRRLLRSQTGGFDAIQKLLQEHSYFYDLSATEKAQWLEYQTLLPGYLLSSQGDRMALGHSVENRCPFLDPNVVALSAAVNLKFDDGSDEKYLLRKAFADKLPRENAEKRKHPYRAPDSRAFVSSRPEYLELLLSEGELSKCEVLNPKFCKLLTEKILSSPADEISTKENQAFIFLLSVALLNHQFAQHRFGGVARAVATDSKAPKVIDLRAM